MVFLRGEMKEERYCFVETACYSDDMDMFFKISNDVEIVLTTTTTLIAPPSTPPRLVKRKELFHSPLKLSPVQHRPHDCRAPAMKKLGLSANYYD